MAIWLRYLPRPTVSRVARGLTSDEIYVRTWSPGNSYQMFISDWFQDRLLKVLYQATMTSIFTTMMMVVVAGFFL